VWIIFFEYRFSWFKLGVRRIGGYWYLETDGNRLTQEEINLIHEKENDIIHIAKGILYINWHAIS
jgi:hypothetical protein